jgi:hypothetical protein
MKKKNRKIKYIVNVCMFFADNKQSSADEVEKCIEARAFIIFFYDEQVLHKFIIRILYSLQGYLAKQTFPILLGSPSLATHSYPTEQKCFENTIAQTKISSNLPRHTRTHPSHYIECLANLYANICGVGEGSRYIFESRKDLLPTYELNNSI